MQHGNLGHHQIYPETLHVPLLVVHPGQRRGKRVETVVASVDLAPTLFDLAGLDDVDLGSGRSLAPAVGGEGAVLAEGDVFAEVFDQKSQLSVIGRRGDGLFQYFISQLIAEPDGTWVTRSATFDVASGAPIEAVSFAEVRSVDVTVDDQPRGSVEVGGAWTPIELGAGCAPCRVTLATAERIAANAPLAVAAARRAAAEGLERTLSKGLEVELSHYYRLVDTADRQEGIQAFNEKRRPRFQGR